MDARLSEEQKELEAAVTRVATDLGPGAVGDLEDTARRGRLDGAIEAMGVRELRSGTPGAPLASGVESALVARALARRSADIAYIGPVLAHDLARRAGAGADVAAATVGVDRGLGSVVVAGDGLAVDGAGADRALAVIEGRLVERAVGEPVSDPVDLTRVARTLGTVGATLGPLPGDELVAFEALAITLTAADLLGAMEGALTLTVDYARERRQFGTPIGSFQAVQHLLADAAALIEGTTSAVLHAAWAVDALEPPEALLAAAVAKAYAARAARRVCESAIQVHGGIGNTWECMAHVFLRRVLTSTEWFGGEAAQLGVVADARRSVA